MQHCHPRRQLADAPRASEEEVARMCQLFNSALKRERPEARTFYRLFKSMDTVRATPAAARA